MIFSLDTTIGKGWGGPLGHLKGQPARQPARAILIIRGMVHGVKTKANDYLRLYCGIDMQFAREKGKIGRASEKGRNGKVFRLLIFTRTSELALADSRHAI